MITIGKNKKTKKQKKQLLPNANSKWLLKNMLGDKQHA